MSNILPDSPVFVHKHMFPALTQNIGEKEEEAMPNLLVGTQLDTKMTATLLPLEIYRPD